jgi:hypothetical protein
MNWKKLFYSKASDESGALFTSPISFIVFIGFIIYCIFFK